MSPEICTPTQGPCATGFFTAFPPNFLRVRVPPNLSPPLTPQIVTAFVSHRICHPPPFFHGVCVRPKLRSDNFLQASAPWEVGLPDLAGLAWFHLPISYLLPPPREIGRRCMYSLFILVRLVSRYYARGASYIGHWFKRARSFKLKYLWRTYFLGTRYNFFRAYVYIFCITHMYTFLNIGVLCCYQRRFGL